MLRSFPTLEALGDLTRELSTLAMTVSLLGTTGCGAKVMIAREDLLKEWRIQFGDCCL